MRGELEDHRTSIWTLGEGAKVEMSRVLSIGFFGVLCFRVLGFGVLGLGFGGFVFLGFRVKGL